jgi:predicted Fe-S protein YdhL (DUF1289 family)
MIYSPCIGICKLKKDICIGCFRSRDEIKAWHKAEDAEREAILRRCKTRASSAGSESGLLNRT